MATLRGEIKDKNDRPLHDCEIALLDEKFRELCLVKSDERGRFQIEAENRIYPYFYAVKNYGVDFLEFWGNNVDLTADFEMTVRIGKIEIYGMNCFQIKCPLPTLSVYFRPMSLTRHLCKEKDIAPELEKENIRVTINGAAAEVLVINRVKEYVTSCRRIPRKFLYPKKTFCFYKFMIRKATISERRCPFSRSERGIRVLKRLSSYKSI